MSRDPLSLETPKAEKVILERRQKADQDLALLMRDERMRSFTHNLLASCRMWATVSHGHAMTAAALSAQRDIALGLYRRLKRLCPDQVALMEQEHLSEFKAIEALEEDKHAI